MPTSWRLARPVVLIALIAAALFPLGIAPAAAQDGEGESAPVVIQGTNELDALVSALRDAYVAQYPDMEVTIDPRGGQNTGFSALCEGSVDIVMSTEPITDLQLKDCANNGQDFVETVLAYEAVVLLPTPEAGVQCVAEQAVYDAWAFGAPQDVTWTDLGAAEYGEPVAFYGPGAVFPSATLFAGLIPAGKLRDDIVVTDDPAAIYDKVLEQGSGAFGYMSLAEYNALEDTSGMNPLALEVESGDCLAPTQSTLAAGSYPLARTDYLYVNAESAQRPEVQGFMQFVLADDAGARALVPEQGYTPADNGAYEYGLNNVMTANAGRTFTRPVTPVSLSATDTGTVRIAGTSMLRELSSRMINTFSAQYPGAELVENIKGNAQGWQAFCTGQADVLQTTQAPTEDDLALCADNGIDPYVVDLGYDAQVIAVPASNDWLTCFDADIAAKLLSRGTADSPLAATWNMINVDWPDSPILLVAPPRNTGESDYLIFNMLDRLDFAMRRDATESSDPSYRARGVANTDNGVTYLWWSDLQGVDADVTLVPVQGADSCVAPDAETITGGSYPLSFPVRYYVSNTALEMPVVRAFLWHMYSDAMLSQYADRGFEGLDVDAMRLTVRDEVYDMLAAFEAEPAEEAPADSEGDADAEATDEEPVDSEGDADAQVTEEAPADSEGDADVEATEEAPADSEGDADATATEDAASSN